MKEIEKKNVNKKRKNSIFYNLQFSREQFVQFYR